MLHLHLEQLKNMNKEILFVYINNAKVSAWLSKGDTYKTYDEIDGVKIFYGSMLSGQGCIDSFSKRRLINEILNNIN